MTLFEDEDKDDKQSQDSDLDIGDIGDEDKDDTKTENKWINVELPARCSDGLERCTIILWDQTRLTGPPGLNGFYSELQALTGDFEFLLNDKVFFEMHYDPGSFGEEIMNWAESEFEPMVNRCARQTDVDQSVIGQVITIERSDDDYLLLRVNKKTASSYSDDETDDNRDEISGN
jgi:hypothetical protein